MKKFFKAFLIVLILLPVVLLFSGCGESAYDLAVKNGYSGTEEQWLASLKGADGKDGEDALDGINYLDFSFQDVYDFAVDNGYTGTYLEFVQEYLNINITTDNTSVINKALLSCVSITAKVTPLTGQAYYSAGSGVIYNLDKTTGSCYIITNYHVVYDADARTSNKISDEIKVYLYGAEIASSAIDATYIGGTQTYDIAVLKITNNTILKNSEALGITIANSNQTKVGSTAIAIGNPEADGISATAGIISVDSEYIEMTAADGVTDVEYRVMRIDAAVNSGNSGGGLFNLNGELIGIVNAKVIEENIENIGYAIPSNIAKNVADNIIDNCEGVTNEQVKKCLLGITVQIENSKAKYDAETKTTSIVETLKIIEVSTSSLSFGKLFADDILKSATIDEQTYELDRLFVLTDLMLSCRVGDMISIKVLRNNIERTINITLTNACVSTIK